jgi:hypothetical protein
LKLEETNSAGLELNKSESIHRPAVDHSAKALEDLRVNTVTSREDHIAHILELIPAGAGRESANIKTSRHIVWYTEVNVRQERKDRRTRQGG